MKSLFLFLAFSVLPVCSPAEEVDNKWTVTPAISKQWTNFNLSDVRLSEGTYFKAMQDKHQTYLHSLNAERLINNVMRAGDIPTEAQNYGGWQHNNGNGFGNYMSGCSQMYAATGDEYLRQQVEWMIDIIDACQAKENLGGYFHFSRTKGFYNQLMSADDNQCKPDNNGEDFYTNSAMAGMVFYQLHRIFYGIRDAYYFANIDKAKDVFIKCMEWACAWTEQIKNDANLQMSLEVEHGGMAELFFDAYAITGNVRFLENGKRWIHSHNFRDKLAQGVDVLTSRHSNVYVPKFMGLIREYEIAGDEINRDAAINTWELVVNRHVMPNGGIGRWERFGQEGRYLDELANTSTETCCTNNMLRFSKTMFSVFGNPCYMDYYERALYNHIVGSKDLDNNTIGGGFCYYQSLLPGMNRKYMDNNSFYCCWETALENHSKYGEAIYFHNDDDVLVNLYIPSSLTFAERGFKMTMTGDYPNENVVTLTIDENNAFTGKIYFRIPHWMEFSKIKVSLNDSETELSLEQTGLAYIENNWNKGDVVTLTMPIELRYETSEEPDLVSIFYGPVLLCPNMGYTSGDYLSDVWQQSILGAPQEFPKFENSKDNLAQWLVKEDNHLLFHGQGVNDNYTFLPFYKANHIKTSIYQQFVGSEDKEKDRLYVTDRIDIGNDTSHDFSGRAFINNIYNRYYLGVKSGNSIQYTMQISPEEGMQHYVELQYDGWETDTIGNFSIFVDDVKIGEYGACEFAQQFTLPHCFFPIPVDLTTGKSQVRLKIQQSGLRAMNFFAIEIVTERYLKEYCPESKYIYGNSPTTIRLEAEAAQPHTDNRTFDGVSSGGAFVSRLSTYLQFNSIYVPKGGDYNLNICRRGSGNVNYTLKINNIESDVKITASTEGWETLSIPVTLVTGFNTICLSPKSGRTPFDIDYIELEPNMHNDVVMLESEKSFFTYSPEQNSIVFKINPLECCKISIYDALGRLCDELQYPAAHTQFNTTKLPRGIYEVRLNSPVKMQVAKIFVR